MGFANEKIIKDMIVEGYKRGVCDKEGNSTNVNGRAVAVPRNIDTSAAFKKKYKGK
jgi:hypothetical protein